MLVLFLQGICYHSFHLKKKVPFQTTEINPSSRKVPKIPLTSACPVVWHECKALLTATFIAALRVGTEVLTATIHYTALIDI